jgi:hypothetical protein
MTLYCEWWVKICCYILLGQFSFCSATVSKIGDEFAWIEHGWRNASCVSSKLFTLSISFWHSTFKYGRALQMQGDAVQKNLKWYSNQKFHHVLWPFVVYFSNSQVSRLAASLKMINRCLGFLTYLRREDCKRKVHTTSMSIFYLWISDTCLGRHLRWSPRVYG